jgi:hypothetical protein
MNLHLRVNVVQLKILSRPTAFTGFVPEEVASPLPPPVALVLALASLVTIRHDKSLPCR